MGRVEAIHRSYQNEHDDWRRGWHLPAAPSTLPQTLWHKLIYHFALRSGILWKAYCSGRVDGMEDGYVLATKELHNE
jgi:hypothetical protein